MKEAWCVPAQSGTAAARSGHWRRCETKPGKEVELLFAEADATRQERAHMRMEHAEMQHRLQGLSPCRKRVAQVASQLATEAALASTSWHHRRHIVRTLKPLCNRRSFDITSEHRRRSK